MLIFLTHTATQPQELLQEKATRHRTDSSTEAVSTMAQKKCAFGVAVGKRESQTRSLHSAKIFLQELICDKNTAGETTECVPRRLQLEERQSDVPAAEKRHPGLSGTREQQDRDGAQRSARTRWAPLPAPATQEQKTTH